MTAYLVLDIHCRPCGGEHPPRLVRFVRASGGGPIGVQPFTVDGHQVIPYYWTRADGGRTWRLVCPHGHEQRVREEHVSAALDTVTPGEDGNGNIRVSL